ncbi:MAG: thioesterase [Acidobacteria bacterium]|nr:thioesterase [Acidobacteriota bacterium]|tara:strand:- start:336 stop:713 length:378 start_codon:yes stop_codon:yes gene_type:complete
MGHVNNAVYFTYFEQTRLVAAETLGLRRTLEPTGLGLILAHSSCDYLLQVKLGDTVEVKLAVDGVGNSSFALRYEVRRVRDDAVVALGKTVQVVFDYEAGEPVQIPESLRDKLDALITRSPTEPE